MKDKVIDKIETKLADFFGHDFECMSFPYVGYNAGYSTFNIDDVDEPIRECFWKMRMKIFDKDLSGKYKIQNVLTLKDDAPGETVEMFVKSEKDLSKFFKKLLSLKTKHNL